MNEFLSGSLLYRTILALSAYYRESLLYRLLRGFIIWLHKRVGPIITASFSYYFANAVFVIARKDTHRFFSIMVWTIFICHLLFDLFLYGQLRTFSLLSWAIALLVIYGARRGRIRHYKNIFSDSMISKILNKKI